MLAEHNETRTSDPYIAGNVDLTMLKGPVFNPHPNEIPFFKEPTAPGSYPYPAGQRPKTEPLLRRALSEEGETTFHYSPLLYDFNLV